MLFDITVTSGNTALIPIIYTGYASGQIITQSTKVIFFSEKTKKAKAAGVLLPDGFPLNKIRFFSILVKHLNLLTHRFLMDCLEHCLHKIRRHTHLDSGSHTALDKVVVA